MHTDYRNNGIGIKLLEEIEKKFEVESIILEVDINNIAAISLYKKLNFHEFSIYPNYYGNNIDAIRMKKIL